MKSETKQAEKISKKNKGQIKIGVAKGTHRNFECRNCRIIDGYTEIEIHCRYCGADLFRIDLVS